jgi:iron complex transport system permease protein
LTALSRIHPGTLLLGLAGLALLAAWFSLDTGSTGITVAQALRDPAAPEAQILWQLRLPRTLSAFVTGALLALAGALMQVLLRNPLADPYVLGVSGGASVGALLALLLGAGAFWVPCWAFSGALFSTLLVFSLAHGRGSWDTTRLLLTGVVLASGWGALISLLLAISPAARIQGMLFWLMGDLSYAQLPAVGGVVLVLVAAIALRFASALNLMSGGALHAAALGVQVTGMQLFIYVSASLATAVAVTQAGNIGFIGLLAPHMLRLGGGRDYRVLIPGVMLLGATLLMLADTLARSVIAPRQLPVGVLTALIGIPLFLFLLYRSRNSRHG